MNKKLIEQAKRHALGQYLTSWGELDYEDVLHALYDSDNELPEEIVVWYPFQDDEPTAVGEAIEDLLVVLTGFGKAVEDEFFTADETETLIDLIATLQEGEGTLRGRCDGQEMFHLGNVHEKLTTEVQE